MQFPFLNSKTMAGARNFEDLLHFECCVACVHKHKVFQSVTCTCRYEVLLPFNYVTANKTN